MKLTKRQADAMRPMLDEINCKLAELRWDNSKEATRIKLRCIRTYAEVALAELDDEGGNDND